MVTANIVEDIIKVVDENPAALEALRARLLTRELLETPARLAELTESHARFAQAANERMDGLESALRESMEAAKAFIQSTNERRDGGMFENHYARELAEKMAFAIAYGQGFAFKRVLPRESVWEMINASDTSGISGNDLMSFSMADLILQVADSAGADCYIVAEVSYTAHWDDAERAIRNSKFIERFTRLPAHPLIAGVDVNRRVREHVVEAGKALWVQLPDRIVQAD